MKTRGVEVLYDQVTLPNGIRIVGERMPYLRSVSVGIFEGVGSQDERPEENGLSHCLEHMVFKGTKSRSARQIAEETDRMGGQFNASTSKEMTVYYAKVLDEKFEGALELLCDLALRPALDEAELQKEKGVILEEIAMVEDSPEDIVHEQLMQAQWGDHPLARTILGPPKVIEELTDGHLREYHDRMYSPKNTVVSIAGNFEIERARAAVERLLGGWQSGGAAPAEVPAPKAAPQVLRKEKAIEQLHMCVGFPGLTYGNLDTYPLTVFNLLFGTAMSSRLFQRIREEKGLAYSVYSYHASFVRAGVFTIYAGLSPKNGEQVMEIIAQEIRDIMRKGVTDEEVTQARDQLKTSFLMGLEATGSRMNGNGYAMTKLGRLRTAEETLALIEKITPEDVIRVAREVFCGGAFSASLVGPGKQGRRGGVGIDFDPAQYLTDLC